MSAAEVSGAAALLAGMPQFPTAAEVREALLGSALDLGAPGQDSTFGNGLLQALNALGYAPGIGTPTPTASPTATRTPPGSDGGGGVWIMSPLALWGTAQGAASCTITNPGNSIDLAFNDALASCATSATGYWGYTGISDGSFGPVGKVVLDARFYASAWPNGTLTIGVSNNNGNSYTTVATFDTTTLPPASLTTVSLDVSNLFTTQNLLNNAQVLFSWTVTGTERTIFVDEARLSVTLGANPTPTLAPPGPTQTVGPNDPHGAYTGTTDKCAACHSAHSAVGPSVLNSAWPEENVCFACHKSGGSGTNVQPAFASYTNTATRFFTHDVAMNAGVHQAGEDTPGSFGAFERHIECVDCHDPHSSARDASYGTTGAPFTQPEMRLVSGVDPTWTAAGSPFVFAWLNEAGREYQICFKCHTGFAALPDYQPSGWNGVNYIANGLRKLTSQAVNQVRDSRDMAEVFNPYNGSYHPLVAPGRNTLMPDSFVAGLGLSTASMIRCSDCHTNANPASGAAGPHGSPNLHLLDGANNYTTVDNAIPVSTGEVCFKCHRQDVYGPAASDTTADLTRFHDGGENLHARHLGSDVGAPCYACHNSHGSQQLRLINFDVSVAFPAPGFNSVSAWQFNGVTASCAISCHGTTHGPGDTIYQP
jgi:predicted CXXCH cytochrome family protein